jgi:hypothetical protein
MQGLIEAFQLDKVKNKKIKKDIGRSQIDDAFDNDPEDHIPSFEESSSFHVGHRDEHVSGPSSSNLKRARKGLTLSLYPTSPLVLNPPLMLNGRRWRRMLLGNALLDVGYVLYSLHE